MLCGVRGHAARPMLAPTRSRRSPSSNGVGEHVGQSPHDQLDSAGSAMPASEHRELVAAQTRDDVVSAHHGVQPLADRAQQLVADLMAELVVDRLEAVEVEVEQVKRASRCRGAGGPARELEPPLGAVGQTGEAVVVGLMGDAVDQAAVLQRGGACAAMPERRSSRSGVGLRRRGVDHRYRHRAEEVVARGDRHDDRSDGPEVRKELAQRRMPLYTSTKSGSDRALQPVGQLPVAGVGVRATLHSGGSRPSPSAVVHRPAASSPATSSHR